MCFSFRAFIRPIIFFTSIFLIVTSVGAKTNSSEPPGILSDFVSPVSTEAWTQFSVGLGLTITLLIFEDQIIDPAQAETTEDKPLGSSSR